MKHYNGDPHNINETLIGAVVKNHRLLRKKKNKILVIENGRNTQSGYKAVVTSEPINNDSFIGVSQVKNLSNINEGDIITIDNMGIINVVHDINSEHNAIFITERCNSNCIMCSQPPVNSEEDRHEINLKHISLLPKNIDSIGITGGEPTLIKDRLIEIFENILKKSPKVNINMLSNAILFDDLDYTKKIAQVINSRTVIDIPLYSDVDTIHNEIVGSKTFYRTIEGIYNLALYKVKIGIRVVVHKLNYKRLSNLAEFIYANFPFVYQIAFMQMEPIGNALVNIKKLWIDPYDYNAELEEAVNILYNRGLYVSIYNSQLCILSEKMHRFAVQSISDWKKVFLDECADCCLKNDCPGFFASSVQYHSRKIKSVKEIQACHV